jgi:hypothetical protein
MISKCSHNTSVQQTSPLSTTLRPRYYTTQTHSTPHWQYVTPLTSQLTPYHPAHAETAANPYPVSTMQYPLTVKYRTPDQPTPDHKNLHTLTCAMQISDQQIPDVLVKTTVSRWSGVWSFTVSSLLSCSTQVAGGVRSSVQCCPQRSPGHYGSSYRSRQS